MLWANLTFGNTKIKYIGEKTVNNQHGKYVLYTGELVKNEIYDVISIENGWYRIWYRIIDNSGENYLYAPENFVIVEPVEGK